MAAPTLVFLPKATQKTTSSNMLGLDDIPQDIKDLVEETYKVLKANDGRMHVAFADEKEKNTFIRQVDSYCKQRMADGIPAPIHYRKSPTRNLPDNELDFRVTDVPTKNEAETKGINDAADAVKDAVKATKATPAKK